MIQGNARIEATDLAAKAADWEPSLACDECLDAIGVEQPCHRLFVRQVAQENTLTHVKQFDTNGFVIFAEVDPPTVIEIDAISILACTAQPDIGGVRLGIKRDV